MNRQKLALLLCLVLLQFSAFRGDVRGRARLKANVSSVKFDRDDLFALMLLIGPTAALALWHKIEWGGGFGPKSGLWRAYLHDIHKDAADPMHAMGEDARA